VWGFPPPPLAPLELPLPPQESIVTSPNTAISARQGLTLRRITIRANGNRDASKKPPFENGQCVFEEAAESVTVNCTVAEPPSLSVAGDEETEQVRVFIGD
jgi:hypothetical protein